MTLEQKFGRKIGTLVKALNHFDVEWEQFDWNDKYLVEIHFDNGVVVSVCVSNEFFDVNDIIFEIGMIVCNGGTYYEPPDCDFTLITKTNKLFECIVEVLLIPEKLNIENKVEGYFMCK